ncbi:hypothetical protein EG329_006639 [Mollisiaceae sp. DMI_Dod_QoI]|nr:hypothetical protein EG329_006639 [Helotiales sp. DMI_Dod_QoI]
MEFSLTTLPTCLRRVAQLVPLEEENLPSNNYFTGLPSTAPPSFCTVPRTLPHRNDENAATIMPRSERLTPGAEQELAEIDDPPISLWGASESTTTRGANSTRNDILMRLLDSVERLEARLDVSENTKKESDLEASTSQSSITAREWTPEDMWIACGIFTSIILAMLFIAAIIIVPAVAKYKYAGAIMASSAIPTPDPN